MQVMELCQHGDLARAIAEQEWQKHQIITWAFQISSALAYIHGRNPPIAHRDIKLQNILLDQSNKAKISDFGLANRVTGLAMTAGVIGTLAYMPPEMLVSDAVHGVKTKRRGSFEIRGNNVQVLTSAHAKSKKQHKGPNLKGVQWDVYSCAMTYTHLFNKVR